MSVDSGGGAMPSAPKMGYLLPTRERVMQGEHSAAPLLELAARAESLGYDSIWVGDSLLARPRHEPLTLLAGVAGRVPRVEVGTAVLLPALRNPVVLAHQVATLDQISEGRLILGVGIAADAPPIRAEFQAAGVPFEKRVGRLLEGMRLCRALWRGEAVDWDGRWVVDQGQLAPIPARAGGPPLWYGSWAPAGIERTAKHFDGWFPTGPDAAGYAQGLARVRASAAEAGRDPKALSAAIYLTVALDPDAERANKRIDDYLQAYYGVPASTIRKRQACYAGPEEGLAQWMHGYAEAGAEHLMLRFAGEHEAQLAACARVRQGLGWI